ncbi:hypothetical protein [Leptolyngbya sp. PCC 6406]|uniref:hypothetical protein n=1 Tax=Leptolyngbya sp. PCC 6406 TaxID=1173264 RepID=UPI0002AC3791|nr:hypothetical protein [Leptolyngbya sp. PCC 6406]
MARISRGVRSRAALSYVSGLGGTIAFPILVGILSLFMDTRQPSTGTASLVLLLGALLMALGGWPTAIALQRLWVKSHPYLQTHGQRAVKLWRAFALVLMGLFGVTILLVVPACAQVADEVPTNTPVFLLSWVATWLFFETLIAIAIMVPVMLVLALRAYLGLPRLRRPRRANKV